MINGFYVTETETTELKRSTSQMRYVIDPITSDPILSKDRMTVEEIRKGNVSDRRNPLLAQKFKDIHFVENWGRGIMKILKLEPDSEFKEIGRAFYTTFLRPMGEHEKVVEKDVDQDIEKDVKKLNNTHISILELIGGNREITSRELSKIIGINQRNIQKYLSFLKKNKCLLRVGSDRSGYWQLNPVQINKLMDNSINWDIEKDVDQNVMVLNSTQLKILELVEKNNKITTRKMSKKIGINHRNTQKVISELKQKGFIKRIGPPRGGHWKIIKEEEED